MARVIVTAAVEDGARWEAAFRTHKKLFREYSATALHYTVADNNEVAIFMKVKKVSTFLEQMAAPETAEAMAGDGVKRDTVRIFVLDKEVDL